MRIIVRSTAGTRRRETGSKYRKEQTIDGSSSRHLRSLLEGDVSEWKFQIAGDLHVLREEKNLPRYSSENQGMVQ